MAHNVPAVTDGLGRGRCVATPPAQTVAEQNTTKGASPTGVLRSLAAEGGVQLQSCYAKFAFNNIITNILNFSPNQIYLYNFDNSPIYNQH
jgi:hypothetical protein